MWQCISTDIHVTVCEYRHAYGCMNIDICMTMRMHTCDCVNTDKHVTTCNVDICDNIWVLTYLWQCVNADIHITVCEWRHTCDSVWMETFMWQCVNTGIYDSVWVQTYMWQCMNMDIHVTACEYRHTCDSVIWRNCECYKMYKKCEINHFCMWISSDLRIQSCPIILMGGYIFYEMSYDSTVMQWYTQHCLLLHENDYSVQPAFLTKNKN